MEQALLHLQLFDEYHQPCCANVGIYQQDQRIFRGYIGETGVIPLDWGVYRIVIRRGKQYWPLEEEITVNGDTHLSFTLKRLQDPKLLGFYAFDSHISRAKMGDEADKPSYRNLWYALLNAGYRLTGIAETDTCGDDPDHLSVKRMVEPFRTYARSEKLGLNEISAAVRRGDCFASSGPLLDYTLDVKRNGRGARGVYTTDECPEPMAFEGKIDCKINPMTRIFVTVDGETKTFEPFFDPQLQDHFRYAYSGAFLKDFPDCRPGEAPVAAFRIPEILDRLGNLTATLDFGFSEAALLFLSQSGQ